MRVVSVERLKFPNGSGSGVWFDGELLVRRLNAGSPRRNSPILCERRTYSGQEEACCQEGNQEASDEEASDQKASDQEASHQEASDEEEASHQEASDEEASYQKASDQEASDEEEKEEVVFGRF